MSEPTSLRETEKRVFQTGFQDGLWDILIGCFILAFAFAPRLSVRLGDFWSSAVLFGGWPLVYALVVLVRRHVVTPRVGVVKYGRRRIQRMMWFNVIMMVVLLVSLGLGLVNWGLSQREMASLLAWVPMLSLGLIFLVLCSIAAYFLDYSRLYVYGILLALAAPIGESLYRTRKVPHHGIPLTFGLTAALVIGVGVVKFVQLLRTYPAPDAQQPA